MGSPERSLCLDLGCHILEQGELPPLSRKVGGIET
jgi:hypothetical protein